MEQHVLCMYPRKSVEGKFNFFLKKVFAVCPRLSTQQRHTAIFFAECFTGKMGRSTALLDVIFAVCRTSCARQRFPFCRVLGFRLAFYFGAHGKHRLCRVPNFRRVLGVAHGKCPLCRVPDKMHTAKALAHGKPRVSGSVYLTR